MAQIHATVTDAAPIRSVRVATGDIAATSTAEVVVTWPDPLVDLNYTVTAVLEHTANPADLDCAVRARTTTGATIAVRNAALAARAATVHATAVPD